MDVSVELINATVQLEQPLADGKRTVGTGFLLSAPTPDGRPRTVLVTATHVLKNMPGAGRAMTASSIAPPGVPTGGGSYGAASNAVHIAR